MLLQSCRVRQGLPRYSPAVLCALLSDPAVNTPSANPMADRIVIPNLRPIMGWQGLLTALYFSIDQGKTWQLVLGVDRLPALVEGNREEFRFPDRHRFLAVPILGRRLVATLATRASQEGR